MKSNYLLILLLVIFGSLSIIANDDLNKPEINDNEDYLSPIDWENTEEFLITKDCFGLFTPKFSFEDDPDYGTVENLDVRWFFGMGYSQITFLDDDDVKMRGIKI